MRGHDDRGHSDLAATEHLALRMELTVAAVVAIVAIADRPRERTPNRSRFPSNPPRSASMSSNYAVYCSVETNCPGGFDYFFFLSVRAKGFSSLKRWRDERAVLDTSFEVVEITMSEWNDGKRTKKESVYRRSLTSREATKVLSRLCARHPDRHFVKRKLVREREPSFINQAQCDCGGICQAGSDMCFECDHGWDEVFERNGVDDADPFYVAESEQETASRIERELGDIREREVRERMGRGLCSCGGVTPPGKLDCVDCHDYRGWFR